MKLTGLHILLTYQCTFECDHCFVWGSPFQNGVFDLERLREVLRQAREVESLKDIYFEGGEPFMYYPLLLQAVREAAGLGFQIGIVSNAYWATGLEDARVWLEPFAGLVSDLSVSSDLFHYSEVASQQSRWATEAAQELGIPTGVISVAQPEVPDTQEVIGQLPEAESGVMYRGRAAAKLAGRARQHPWQKFTSCPFEDLVEPGRIHLDPFGNLHLCQGILIGNMFTSSLKELCSTYDPYTHPIVSALLQGGPRQLAQRYGIQPIEQYADACQLCYETRISLRGQFANLLAPDAVYGIY